VLLAKLAGAMAASLQGAVSLFAAPLSQTARLLEALRAQTERTAAPVEEPAAAPVTEQLAAPVEEPAAESVTEQTAAPVEEPAAEPAPDGIADDVTPTPTDEATPPEASAPGSPAG
jgi:large subunit ribosomal protein L10